MQAAEAEAKEAKRKTKEERKRQADERACVKAEAWNTMKAKEREAAYYASLRTPPPPDEDDEEWEPDFPRARVAEFEKAAQVQRGGKGVVRAIKTDKTKVSVAKAKCKRATNGNKTNAAVSEDTTAESAISEPKTDAQINADLEEFISAYLGGTVDSSNDPDLTTIDLETGATLQPAPPGPVQNDTAGAPGTVHADAPSLVFFGGVLYVRVDALPQPAQPAKHRKPGSGRPLGSKDKQKRRKHDPYYEKPKGGPMGRPVGSLDKQKRWSKNNPKPAAGTPTPILHSPAQVSTD